jgi:hypothetical protein
MVIIIWSTHFYNTELAFVDNDNDDSDNDDDVVVVDVDVDVDIKIYFSNSCLTARRFSEVVTIL